MKENERYNCGEAGFLTQTEITRLSDEAVIKALRTEPHKKSMLPADYSVKGNVTSFTMQVSRRTEKNEKKIS